MSNRSELKRQDEFKKAQHDIIMQKQQIIKYLESENAVLRNAIRAVVKRSPSQDGNFCGFAHVDITAYMQVLKAYELTSD